MTKSCILQHSCKVLLQEVQKLSNIILALVIITVTQRNFTKVQEDLIATYSTCKE